MSTKMSKAVTGDNTTLDSILQRLDAMEGDHLQLRLRCEDLEDENEDLRREVATMSRSVEGTIGKIITDARLTSNVERETRCGIIKSNKNEDRKLSAAPEGYKVSKPARIMNAKTHKKAVRVSISPGGMSQTSSDPVRSSIDAAIFVDTTDKPTQEEVAKFASFCKQSKWADAFDCIKKRPTIATETFCAGSSKVPTSPIHQVIAGKGDANTRSQMIDYILDTCPECSRIRNGHGGLALHAICQRNIDLPAKTKRRLALKIMDTYPDAVSCKNKNGGRTPLHVFLTEKWTNDIMLAMIRKSPDVLKIADKHGFLPLHVHCSKACQIDKVQILYEAYPDAIFATTDNGDTPLSLAVATCTRKGQPHHPCIQYLKNRMALRQQPQGAVERFLSESVTGLPAGDFHRRDPPSNNEECAYAAAEKPTKRRRDDEYAISL